MKRIFALIISVIILMSLCSCGATEVDFYNFSGNFSPFFARTTYDLSVAAQTQETLLVTSGDEASIVLDGYTQGLGIADIEVEKLNEKAVCTVKLGKDICFSDGTPLTAKDVIFSMYVYADINYTGWSRFGVSAIDGLVNYQYGIDEAENISVTDEEIAAELNAPSELTQRYIVEQIITPVLTEEAEWVKTLYGDPSYKGTEAANDIKTYTEPHKLFEYYYALVDSDVSTADATDMPSMLAKVIEQYGCDYELLGKVYGSDLSVIAEDIAKRTIMYNKLGITTDTPSGGKLRGVELVDDYTLKVTVNATTDSQLTDVLGIFVAPFHYYGKGCTDNGDGSFTINYDSIKTLSGAPLGAGEYVFEEYTAGESVRFVKNERYFRTASLKDKLVFNVTGSTSTPTAHEYFVKEENVTFADE